MKGAIHMFVKKCSFPSKEALGAPLVCFDLVAGHFCLFVIVSRMAQLTRFVAIIAFVLSVLIVINDGAVKKEKVRRFLLFIF